MELNYHVEDAPLGTAGAIRNLEEPSGSLLVMNGDILTTLPYADLISFHEERGAALTIASHRAEIKLELGVIEGESSAVTGYVEKPTLDYEVSMGIYAYSPTAVAHIPEGKFDLPDLVHYSTFLKAEFSRAEIVAVPHEHRIAEWATWPEAVRSLQLPTEISLTDAVLDVKMPLRSKRHKSKVNQRSFARHRQEPVNENYHQSAHSNYRVRSMRNRQRLCERSI